MTEINALKPVSLREVWPNEAWDFTPWLADNLHLLGSKLNLELELVDTELTLPVAGRVDILAKQTSTEAKVVIENQLEESDDSHCLRLLGYAANADANILVWVARDFHPYHRGILSWLNESDNIAVYAVKVKAYQVGDNTAVDFELVIEPQQSQPGTTSTSTGMNTNTYYANFFRPVVAQLRNSGLHPVSRGGWRGGYRSFQTGYSDVIYAVSASDGDVWVSLVVSGADNQCIYHQLTQHRADIDAELNAAAEWEPGDESSWLILNMEADTGDLQAVEKWIVENLLLLRDVVQPHLGRVMGESTDAAEDAVSVESGVDG